MKKIYINPGHSDKDPGAVGYETERKLNLTVSQHMNDYLLGNYLCQTRVYSDDSLTAVCNDANSWGADLFVSNHFNAGGGDGYEALVYSQKRVELGKVFEKYVLTAGQNSRGVKIRTNLHVLKYTAMPALINEGAFVDNLSDIQDWNNDAELKALGIAYAKAAAEFLALEKKTAKENEPAAVYSLQQFIRNVQAATGSVADGIAGPETLRNTVTVSAGVNPAHPVVEFIQKRLAALGYTQVGAADGLAGGKFTAAVKAFQQDNGCTADGEITARNKTWRKLLGME